MQQYIELATALVAGMAALGVSTRKILVALRRNFEQTQPNGGSTLRDAIARIEHQVTELRALNRGYLNLTGGGIFTADRKGRCTWVSREWTELTGVSAEDAQGGGWLAGVSDTDRFRVHDEWTMFIGSSGAIEFNSLFSTAEGIEVQGRAVPVESEVPGQDDVTGYFGQFKQTDDSTRLP